MTTTVTADSVVEWQRFAIVSEGFVKFGIVDPPCLYKHQVTICACVFGRFIGGFAANTAWITMDAGICEGGPAIDNRRVGISVKVTKGPVRQKTSL